MKEIQLTVDQNGRVTPASGGVMGEHNAATLHITFEGTPPEVDTFRLCFGSEQGTLLTQLLTLQQGEQQEELVYPLPQEVTKLGTQIACQLYGYRNQEDTVEMLWKSQEFSLYFATSLPEPHQVADAGFTDRVEEMLAKTETIARTFDVTIGQVNTVPCDQPATATLTKSEDFRYTLNLTLPKGETGEFPFTLGEGLVLNGDTLAAKGNYKVYNAISDQNRYIGIEEEATIEDLAGRLLIINPAYSSTQNNLHIYTTAALQNPRALYRMENNTLISTFPYQAVVSGRPMMVYVNQLGLPIYLNPNMPQDTLPVINLTPNYSNAGFPAFSFDQPNNYFVGGKTVVAIPTEEVYFNGNGFFGPLMSPIYVFRNGQWVNASCLTDKSIPAGQAMLMQVEYNPNGYSFSTMRLLNPPV